MARIIRRYNFLWFALLVGCSSQGFCEFQDTAPILNLPVPNGASSLKGWGSVMINVEYEKDDGVLSQAIAVAGGPASMTTLIQLAADGEISIDSPAELSEICNKEARKDDSTSSCYERHAGAGLGLRSEFNDGQVCLAVGMAGHEREGGLGFWCALGTRHTGPMPGEEAGPSLVLYPSAAYEVQDVAHVFEPEERIFVGTDRSLDVLVADSYQLVRVEWDIDGLPGQADATSDLSALEVGDLVPSGQLLAVGYGGQSRVLIVEIGSPESADDPATLTPRACIASDEPGFGSVVKLTTLRPEGEPVLIAGASMAYDDRVPALHIFDIDLTVAPEDVTCDILAPPVHTLQCGDIGESEDGVDRSINVDCTVDRSGFGVALDVGNIDDTEEYEVIVGCPNATADGYANAGAGYVFRPERNGDEVLPVLTDSSLNRADAQLGNGVIIADVGDRQEPVLAGSGESSLLMFLCTGVGDEAPLWDSPLNGGSLEDERCRNPNQ